MEKKLDLKEKSENIVERRMLTCFKLLHKQYSDFVEFIKKL